MKEYQICTRCVMDTTDPEIFFNEHGICHHCERYDAKIQRTVIPGEKGQDALKIIAERIRSEGRRKKYDCVIGVSGGVDSTYTAWVVKQLGLRPLAVHLDNGWDSELAVSNIHNALKILNIDLYTHVIDWNEFKDLQLSFLLSSTPDSEIPSDHAIASIMRIMAEKIGVRYVIIGFNVRNESHLPRSWSQGHYDWDYIKAINKKFGHKKLHTFPHMGFWTYKRYALTQEIVEVLNYGDYSKSDAIRLLESELGWRNYGGKHFESIYTRFYQGYILPTKFGFDKRKCHLSSLICSGEITREQALRELLSPPYPDEQMEDDKAYVIKKFGLSEEEFKRIMSLPKKTYWDYPNYMRKYEFFERLASINRLRKKIYDNLFHSNEK